MKLVFDEHYSPVIAAGLRERGYDVVAVVENDDLRAMADPEVFRWAQGQRRVVITENVGDYMALHRAYLSRGEDHYGIVFTSSRAFSRRLEASGRLITALARFLESRPDDGSFTGQIGWLQ